MVTKPLSKVLILHTGGTLGMDPQVRRPPGRRLQGPAAAGRYGRRSRLLAARRAAARPARAGGAPQPHCGARQVASGPALPLPLPLPLPPPQDSYEPDEQSSGGLRLKPGTGGKYRDGKGLKPGDMLRNLLSRCWQVQAAGAGARGRREVPAA